MLRERGAILGLMTSKNILTSLETMSSKKINLNFRVNRS